MSIYWFKQYGSANVSNGSAQQSLETQVRPLGRRVVYPSGYDEGVCRQTTLHFGLLRVKLQTPG